MNKPSCWKCASFDVKLEFTGYAPVYHLAEECECAEDVDPCGTVPQGKLTCRGCGNVWVDGDISEFGYGN